MAEVLVQGSDAFLVEVESGGQHGNTVGQPVGEGGGGRVVCPPHLVGELIDRLTEP